MPKKSKEEFKEAFKVIKKPSLKAGVTSKDKRALETAVDKDDDKAFIANADKMSKANKPYFIDLVAYKFAKHFENDDKRPFWQDKVPPDIQKAALEKVVPNGMEDKLTQRTFEKAVEGSNQSKGTVAMIYQRDPEGTLDLVLDKLEQYGPGDNRDARKQIAWSQSVKDIEGDNFDCALLTHLMKKGDAKSLQRASACLANASPADAAKVAATDRKLFIENILTGLKGAGLSKILANPNLCADLEAAEPDAWQAFADTVPALKTIGGVQKKELTDSGAIVGELFSAIMSGADMPLGYVGTKVASDSEILGGSSATPKPGNDNEPPEVPRTDCHNITNIVQLMMEAYPGLKPTISRFTCRNMLMTKPLSSIPGKGLLDRSFAGNVFDDAKQPTGRVLFTGEGGAASHTWLIVDKVAYDAVMGTKGDEVEGAVHMYFDWALPNRVGRGDAGWFFVQDAKLKPAGNKMSFNTGYILTKKPASYLTAQEAKKLGARVKEMDEDAAKDAERKQKVNA